MKKIIVLFAFAGLSTAVWAQEEKVSQYTFPNFENGIVKFKVGADLQAMLNYNTIREEMLFKNGDSILAIAEVDKIEAILIKGHKFIPNDAVFYEEIPVKGAVSLYIRHIATLNAIATDTGLGKTKTASQSKISTLNSANGIYTFILPEYDIKHKDEFYLKLNNKFVFIKNANSFNLLFPEQIKDVKKFISDQRIDLNKSTNLIKVLEKFSK